MQCDNLKREQRKQSAKTAVIVREAQILLKIIPEGIAAKNHAGAEETVECQCQYVLLW